MISPTPEPGHEIVWRLHVVASPERVFDAWLNPAEQARFWCERSERTAGGFRLRFIDGTVTECIVLQADRPRRISFSYFHAHVDIAIEAAARGTDLALRTQPRESEWLEAYAGWVNVLLPLKAWVDFSIDLRNHDPARTWRERYVDQ